MGSVVTLQGQAADPGDGLPSVFWQILQKPSGSTSQVAASGLLETTFVPDRAGVYVARLTPSDTLGAGAHDDVQITATTVAAYGEGQIQAASALIAALPPAAVTSPGNRNALMQFLGNAIASLQSGNSVQAVQRLDQALIRIDGCTERGAADGNGPGRDWVVPCDEQSAIYALVKDARDAVAP